MFYISDYNYLKNVTVTVGNTSSVESASVCATYPGVPVPAKGSYLFLICAQPILGRYVTIRQLTASNGYNLALSDVKVYGESLLGE